MNKSIEINFNNKTLQFSLHNGHVWLNLECGISVPLQMMNCQEGGRYAYLTIVGDGDATHEVRIYDNGEVCGD